jgi:hypothetical protein
VFFSGAEPQRRRAQNIVDFHDDPAVRLMFCSDAGAVGLNLQRAASTAVILDLPWNPAVLEQRVGRIYRLGQKRPIQVYYLVSEGGIEARIARLIGDKQALFTGLFDGESDEVVFESSGSFLSRVEKLVDPVEVPDLPETDAPDAAPALDFATDLPDLADDVALPTGAASLPAARGTGAAAEATGVYEPSRGGPASAGPPPAQVGDMLSRLQVVRRPDGGLAIEAPPEAAETLATLFAGMARLLSEAAADPGLTGKPG